MQAGTRFHNFLQRTKWKKTIAKREATKHDFPDFIKEEIRQAWTSECFPWQGEQDWNTLTRESTNKITTRHPWLKPFDHLIQDAISNY